MLAENHRLKRILLMACIWVIYSIRATLAAVESLVRQPPRPLIHDPGRGLADLQAAIDSDNPRAFHRRFRMTVSSFEQLLTEVEPYLQAKTRRRRANGVTPREMLAIFLDWVGLGHTQADQAYIFQRSEATISRARRLAMEAIVHSVYSKYVTQPDEPTPIKGNDSRYIPFSGALGALDGTHIAVTVPTDLKPAFRNRKGFTSQNVLIACDFDLRITYCAPGAEGCAHDAQILRMAEDHIHFPENSYYLGQFFFFFFTSCSCPGAHRPAIR
jgi:hypothetical protein